MKTGVSLGLAMLILVIQILWKINMPKNTSFLAPGAQRMSIFVKQKTTDGYYKMFQRK